MRAADVTVGARVVWASNRVGSAKRRRYAEYQVVTVVAVGQPHTYEVSTGGWDGWMEARTTQAGVRIRMADGTERVTLAACLSDSPEEFRLAEYAEARRQAALEARERMAADTAALEALVAARGVGRVDRGRLVLTLDEARALGVIA